MSAESIRIGKNFILGRSGDANLTGGKITFGGDSVLIDNLKVQGDMKQINVVTEDIIFNDHAIRIGANYDLVGTQAAGLPPTTGVNNIAKTFLNDGSNDKFFGQDTAGIVFGQNADPNANITTGTGIIALSDDILFTANIEGDSVNLKSTKLFASLESIATDLSYLNENSGSSSQLDDLETDVSTISDVYGGYLSTLNDAKDEHAGYLSTLDTRTDNLNIIAGTHTGYLSTLDTRTDNLDTLTGTHAGYLSTLDTRTDDLDTLTGTHAGYLSTLNDAKDEHAGYLSSLNTEFSTVDLEFSTLNNEVIPYLEGEIADINTTLSELDVDIVLGRISSLEENASTLYGYTSNLNGLTDDHAGYLSTLNGLTDDHAGYLSTLNGLTDDHAGYLSTLNGLTDDHAGYLSTLNTNVGDNSGALEDTENGFNQFLFYVTGSSTLTEIGPHALSDLNTIEYSSEGITAPAFTTTSDETLKTNITPLSNATAKILSLRGVWFNWKTDLEGEKEFGVIAQETERVFPSIVNINKKSGIRSVDYGRLTAAFIEAIRELDARVKLLESR